MHELQHCRARNTAIENNHKIRQCHLNIKPFGKYLLSKHISEDADDFWLGIARPSSQAQDVPNADSVYHALITVEPLLDVVPLDEQFGIWPRKTVPDGLREALFGQQDRTKPEGSFAVLDAAKVFGLADFLDSEDLTYRCLFKGAAETDLRDVAPYLVQLDEASDLTRRLFTRSQRAGGLWDNVPGIYLRTTASFDSLWRHLRRYIRVQDENGTWMYFRFWEMRCLHHYLTTIADSPTLAPYWSATRDGHPLCYVMSDGSHWNLVRGSATVAAKPPFQMTRESRDILAQYQHRRFHIRLADYLQRETGDLEICTASKAADLTERAIRHGFTIEKAIGDFALAALLAGSDFLTTSEVKQLLATQQHQLDKACKILSLARANSSFRRPL
ncbi:DUF4123 domain-containing protein [Tritonibacter mobilis]|jgi:hypothetical protein|uniref:DUF4123 domain-containing protein n=1 Tax=Tritonibacter mobilis TaxID=379347 RepID=UPI000806F058|nr:DUF4123 domain-containing protein [Tritonibacter mobilis]SDX37490.1 protein of unknown function [Tritonibacter mobilis]